MNMTNKLKVLKLPYPHPYLITKGKQTKIIYPEELPINEKMGLVCGDEIYGYITLKQPAQIAIDSFHLTQEEHCVREGERKLWWADEKKFYIYPFEFESFKKLKRVEIENGEIVRIIEPPVLSEKEKELINNVETLPKYILLEKNAVYIGPNDYLTISPSINPDILVPLIEANYNQQFNVTNELKGSHLPIYGLGLVRITNPEIHYRQKTKDDAPNYKWSNDESKKCPSCKYSKEGYCELYDFQHDKMFVCDNFVGTEDSKVESEKDNEMEADMPSKGIIRDIDKLRNSFQKQFEEDDRYYYLMDMNENNIIVETYGIIYSVGWNGSFDSPVFESMENWIEVEPSYIPVKDQENLPLVEDENGEYKQEEKMPYEIVPDHPECDLPFAVVKTTDGDVMGCHETVEQAEDQITALSIAETEDTDEMEEEKQEGFDDSEWSGSASNWETTEAYCSDCLIDVNPSGKDKVQALCKLPYRKPGGSKPNINAIRAIGGGRGFTVLEKPEEVDSDTWNSEIKKAANKVITWWPKAFDKPAPDSVYKAAGKEPPEKSFMQQAKEKVNSALEGIKEAFGLVETEVLEKEQTKTYEFAVKNVNGEPWFVCWGTSAFEDRDKEIFTTKALEEYCKENMTNPYKGYFNVFHIPNTDFAEKKWQGVVGRILVEAGPFLKDKKGKKAFEFFKKYPDNHPELAPEGWGASVEYKFLAEDLEEGVYKWLWVTRTSVLPKSRAANMITKGSLMMTLSKQQEEMGKQIFGEDMFMKEIVKPAEEKSLELEKDGLRFKKAESEEEVAEELIQEKPEDSEKEPEIEVVVESKEETEDVVKEKVEEEPEPQEKLELLAEKLKNTLNLEERFVKIEETVHDIRQGMSEVVEQLKQSQVIQVGYTSRASDYFNNNRLKRASEMDETEVTGDLKNKKPEENKDAAKRSGANVFFPNRK